MSVDLVDALLDSVRECIAAQGGELIGCDELRAELAAGLGRRDHAQPIHAASEASERVWTSPDAAGVKYSDVWICQTASGSVVLVHVSSHRRLKHRTSRPRWYGVDILSGREVRIRRVLEGSRR